MRRRIFLGLAAVGIALVSCLTGIAIGMETPGTERVVEKTVEVPVEVEVVRIVTQVVEVPVEVEVVKVVTADASPSVTAQADQTDDRSPAEQHPLVKEFGCQWIMDSYRPMTELGRDFAIQHLSTEMMLKRGGLTHIGTGDAAEALRECEAEGFK